MLSAGGQRSTGGWTCLLPRAGRLRARRRLVRRDRLGLPHPGPAARIVAADVLDAWFPPAPGVLAALADDPAWIARTSPPTAPRACSPRSPRPALPDDSVAVGAGSSDLIFRAFRHWLTPASRVLLMDPSYGEYAHVMERVIGCRVDRLRLRRDGRLADRPGPAGRGRRGPAYDLVVLVNPNNPTGRHAPAPSCAR